MAKTQRIELQQIADYHNLAQSFVRAARGKRRRAEVQSFVAHWPSAMAQLQQSILAGCLPVGGQRSFWIRDPKRRLIHAAPFADRVVHHALLAQTGNALERWQVTQSYACRVDKGVHRALLKAQQIVHRNAVVLQLDIAQYFPHIAHRHLRTMLQRRLRGTCLQLYDTIIDSYHAPCSSANEPRGLTIGSLSSQHLANAFLTPLDRLLIDAVGGDCYMRYMDDFLIGVSDIAQAKRIREMAQDRLAQWGLMLRIGKIQYANQGINFLGWRLRPTSAKPSHRRQRRYRQAVAHWSEHYQHGDPLQAINAINSLRQSFAPFDPHGYWRRCNQRGERGLHHA